MFFTFKNPKNTRFFWWWQKWERRSKNDQIESKIFNTKTNGVQNIQYNTVVICFCCDGPASPLSLLTVPQPSPAVQFFFLVLPPWNVVLQQHHQHRRHSPIHLRPEWTVWWHFGGTELRSQWPPPFHFVLNSTSFRRSHEILFQIFTLVC